MSEEHIVRNCAPTLAGIKTANLFTCPIASPKALQQSLCCINRRLQPKGLRILPLRVSEHSALIYAYRPKKLSQDLSDSDARLLLKKRGYEPENCERCVCQLAKKLRMHEEFPHEIGLFLGYPVEDVCGFIENGATNAKCTGCWKVYGDAEAAQKKFAQYKKCTRVYCAQLAKGSDIERLTVAV